MDVSTSFFSQISKELEVASDETHTLLSSLAPQIIHKQQSEVEALRTHTDSHYVHFLPPVLSCLRQRQIKRQQERFLAPPGQLSPDDDLIHGPSDLIWQGFDLPEKRR